MPYTDNSLNRYIEQRIEVICRKLAFTLCVNFYSFYRLNLYALLHGKSPAMAIGLFIKFNK